MQDKARAITKMNRKPPPNTDSIRNLLVRYKTRSIFHARTPSPESDSSENNSRKDEREDENQNSQEEGDLSTINRNVDDVTAIMSPRDEESPSRYSYSSDSDWSTSDKSCRTGVETNSPTPNNLLSHPPAAPQSVNLDSLSKGMPRSPSMPRPPTSRRPLSMARPSSTSRPTLMPHPPSTQRVRAGQSPSNEPRTRTSSRQSMAARRTMFPGGSNSRTQQLRGEIYRKRSVSPPILQRRKHDERPVHQGNHGNQSREGHLNGESEERQSTSHADELKAETKNTVPPSANISDRPTSSVAREFKELSPGHSPSSNTRSTVLQKTKTAQEMVELKIRFYGPSTSPCQTSNTVRIPDYLKERSDDGTLPHISSVENRSFKTKHHGVPRPSMPQDSVVPGSSAKFTIRQGHSTKSSKMLSIERIPLPPKGPCPRKTNRTRLNRRRDTTEEQTHQTQQIPEEQLESGSGDDMHRKVRFSWFKNLKKRYAVFRQ